MKSIKNFIISTDERYLNEIDVDGGRLVVNTEISERDYHFVNRVGRVVSTPIMVETPVEVGDLLIVHHNIFRRWYDVRGNERNSGNFIDEDLYNVALDQVYAYNKGDGWKAVPGYCFVKPVEGREGVLEIRRELTGVLLYSDDYLTSQGVYEGDMVCFSPESEYEFNIDGEKLYRVRTQDITIKLYEKAKVKSHKGGGGGPRRIRESRSPGYRFIGARPGKSQDSRSCQEAGGVRCF